MRDRIGLLPQVICLSGPTGLVFGFVRPKSLYSHCRHPFVVVGERNSLNAGSEISSKTFPGRSLPAAVEVRSNNELDAALVRDSSMGVILGKQDSLASEFPGRQPRANPPDGVRFS
jgi:hypothetical protein